MINLSVNEGLVTFEFTDNDRYLQDGTIEVPVNSLMLVTDESEMFTFRKAVNFDIFISGLYSEIGKTKAELETYFKENMVNSGGGSTADTEALKGIIDRSITSIDIPSGVTKIGDYAFASALYLSAVTMPDTVTSIGNEAFYGASNLMNIEIPNGVTSIGQYAFYGCAALSEITIPSGVTNIANYTFTNCQSLTGVTISSGVTSIGNYAFQNCRSLSAITIQSMVNYIGNNAFDGCSGLTSINIPSGVTTINGSAFQNCFSLTSVTIPSGVTSINQYAFRKCSGLTSVDIPSGVTSIGAYAFEGCSGLTAITLTRVTPPTLSNNSLDNTNNCPIYVPEESVSAYKSASGWSNYASRIQSPPYLGKIKSKYTDGTTYTADCSVSTIVTSADTAPFDYTTNQGLESSVVGDCATSIDQRAFTQQYLPNLKSIKISDNVTSIGEQALSNLPALESVNIPTGLTEIPYGMLLTCPKLKSNLVVPSGVTSIGSSAFDGDASLSSITIKATTPPTLQQYNYAFFVQGANKYPIYVPSASVETYKTTEYWTDWADRIEPIVEGKWRLTYQNGAVSQQCTSYSTTISSSELSYTNVYTLRVGECVTEIGSSACYNKTTLSSVTLSDSVKTIGQNAFRGCTSLKSMIIPDSVTSIGASAFTECTSLEFISLPNGITTISNSMLQGCTGLTDATIPASVTSIGRSVFFVCSNLSRLTCLATTPPTLGSLALDSTNLANGTIYVPAASVDTYKAASGWSTYANVIQGI